MNKQELIEDHKEIAAHHRKMAKRAQVEIDRLTAEIEAEKPKLRHGDYGVDWIVLNRRGTLEWFGIRKGAGQTAHLALVGGPRLSNIFDDLAALQEDVDGFEIDSGSENYPACAEFTWNNSERTSVYFRIKRENDGRYIAVDIDELILKLSQMRATQKRAAGHNE